MYYEVVSVRHINGYILEVLFKDGTGGTIDLAEYKNKGGVFSAFEDIEFFKKVFINPGFGTLTWPGEIDIAPETIYIKATGKSLKQVG